jgi:hypothetical protein
MHRPTLIAQVNGFTTETMLAGLLFISALLTSCSELAYAPIGGPPVGEYAPGTQPYGADGSVTDAQAIVVESLAWPQSRADMVGGIGYPTHMTEWADYYSYQSRWLVIRYSGPEAVGYQYEDK